MFASAKLKVERAHHHIRDAERQIESFIKKNVHGISSHTDVGGGLHVFTMLPSEPLPSEIALIVGDAIHNLRTALDHLTWQVVGWAGGTQDRYLKFPAGEDRASCEGSCNGIKATPLAVKDMFKTLEAFPDGTGHFLYVLNTLNNADKHAVLTPIVQVTSIKKLVLRDSNGHISHTLSNMSTVRLLPGETLTVDVLPDATFIDFENDAEISLDVLFGEVKFVQNEPILPTLVQLRDAVLNTIEIVERSCS